MREYPLVAWIISVGFFSADAPSTLLHSARLSRTTDETSATSSLPSTGAAWRENERRLLHAAAPETRLRAALALASTADPEAISTLIGLFGELQCEEAQEVEDCLRALAGPLAPQVRLRGGEADRLRVRDAWRKWWRRLDGEEMLQQLKKLAILDADSSRIAWLVQRLADPSFVKRQKAEQDLIGLGPPIIPLLKHAHCNADPEARIRIQRCIACLEVAKRKSLSLLPALARLLALRTPLNAAETILTCLPSVDEDVVYELQQALNACAYLAGKPQQVLLRALKDRSAARRAAAAQALCAGTWAGHAASIRRLLKDSDLTVRLKTALALVSADDAMAVPALIALVAELPVEEAAQVEEYLHRLARGQGPANLPERVGDRKRRNAQWSAWWESNKNHVALVDLLGLARRERFQLHEAYHGYTLLVQMQDGAVMELGVDGKPRWMLTGLMCPCDVQVIAGRRVLVVELSGRVSELTLTGKTLWEKRFPGAISAQRLGNGDTLITCSHEMVEIDQAGQEVLRIHRGEAREIRAARKLVSGLITIYESGRLVLLDGEGRQLKSNALDVDDSGCHEILENGHVLITSPIRGKLMEFDGDGRKIHCVDALDVSHAFRVSNGHTLAIIGGTKCVEFDTNWHLIKETDLERPAFRVKQR